MSLALGGSWEEARALRDDQAIVYAAPARRERVRELVADLVSGAQPVDEEATRRAREAGLELDEEQDRVTLAAPGDGAIVIRREQVEPLVLQAPHAFFDTHTGAIAGALFDEGLGQVVMFNTAHRYRGDQEQPEPADVAHLAESVFQAATLGAAQGLQRGLVVQLHGFSAREEHPDLAIVASEGGALQPPSLLAQALRVLSPFGQVLPGSDVPDLAARGNAQSRALTGTARFLHLEMSLALREQLREDSARRSELAAVLRELAR